MIEEDKKQSNWLEYVKKYGAMASVLIIIAVGFFFVFTPESIAVPTCNPKSAFVEFYGSECPYCASVVSLVSQVENETGVKFEKLEVAHNKTNQQVFMGYNSTFQRDCGVLVVPTFLSQKTNRAICGVISKENLTKFVIENC